MLPSAIPNARIMHFGYDSMWLGHNPVRTNIRVIANNLHGALVWERKVGLYEPLLYEAHMLTHDMQDCKDHPLIFIGHWWTGYSESMLMSLLTR